MTPAEALTLVAYFFVLIVLAIYGWHRYYLVYLYMSNRDKEPQMGPPLDPLPVVTIQLPLYNEMYVAERLIEAVCAIDYPRDRLEIQVLDDSTDETREHCRPRRAPVRRAGDRHRIHPPRRIARATRPARSRRGSRSRAASSSRFSTPTSSRRPIFSRGLIPHFRDPKVGMVQARWGHINQDYSLLTKIQAMLLDGHFVLEHGGRNRGGLLLQLQRHRGHLAARRHRRRRRLAARHAHRGSRSQLPRADARAGSSCSSRT